MRNSLSDRQAWERSRQRFSGQALRVPFKKSIRYVVDLSQFDPSHCGCLESPASPNISIRFPTECWGFCKERSGCRSATACSSRGTWLH